MAKRKPAAKASPTANPAAKQMSRGARLPKAEAEVQAAKPRDWRCMWRACPRNPHHPQPWRTKTMPLAGVHISFSATRNA